MLFFGPGCMIPFPLVIWKSTPLVCVYFLLTQYPFLWLRVPNFWVICVRNRGRSIKWAGRGIKLSYKRNRWENHECQLPSMSHSEPCTGALIPVCWKVLLGWLTRLKFSSFCSYRQHWLYCRDTSWIRPWTLQATDKHIKVNEHGFLWICACLWVTTDNYPNQTYEE